MTQQGMVKRKKNTIRDYKSCFRFFKLQKLTSKLRVFSYLFPVAVKHSSHQTLSICTKFYRNYFRSLENEKNMYTRRSIAAIFNPQVQFKVLDKGVAKNENPYFKRKWKNSPGQSSVVRALICKKQLTKITRNTAVSIHRPIQTKHRF